MLWRRDEAQPDATKQPPRPRLRELIALDIVAEPVLFDESIGADLRTHTGGVDGVPIWVDPLHQDHDPPVVDALLRAIAARGPISAHSDTILKMGTNDVRYCSTHLGWGTDTHLYRTAAELCVEFPECWAGHWPAFA